MIHVGHIDAWPRMLFVTPVWCPYPMCSICPSWFMSDILMRDTCMALFVTLSSILEDVWSVEDPNPGDPRGGHRVMKKWSRHPVVLILVLLVHVQLNGLIVRESWVVWLTAVWLEDGSTWRNSSRMATDPMVKRSRLPVVSFLVWLDHVWLNRLIMREVLNGSDHPPPPPPHGVDAMAGTTMWRNGKLSGWRTEDHAVEEPDERMSTIRRECWMLGYRWMIQMKRLVWLIDLLLIIIIVYSAFINKTHTSTINLPMRVCQCPVAIHARASSRARCVPLHIINCLYCFHCTEL